MSLGKMRIASRLGLGFGLVIVLLAIVAGTSLLRLTSSMASSRGSRRFECPK